MAKKDPSERELAALEAARNSEDVATRLVGLRKALGSNHARVVVKAARLAGESGIDGLGPDMEAAFDRFMRNPVKSDPGCMAKLEIVKALHELNGGSEDVLLAGLHYVQKEPVWGRPVDTAADLRGACLMCLAQAAYPEIHLELAVALLDPEVQARRAAVRAAVHLGTETAEALLRMKAKAGDIEPDVTGLCLSGLMAIGPRRSLAFVSEFLECPDPAVVEGAALALGESHDPDALAQLLRCWEANVDASTRAMLALPIALSRLDPAFDFLLDALREKHASLACAVVSALALYRHDEDRRRQIEAAVGARGDTAVVAAYRKTFDEG